MPDPTVVRYQARSGRGGTRERTRRFPLAAQAIQWVEGYLAAGGTVYAVETGDGPPPIHLATLRAMLRATDPHTLRGSRDRALLAYGWHTQATHADISYTGIESFPTVLADLRASTRRPTPAWVAHNLQDWLLALSIALDEPALTGHLFRPVTRHDQLDPQRTHLSYNSGGVTDIIIRAARAARLPDADRYTLGSLRLGGRLRI